INPPSIGVASFDGLDQFGNPYDNSALNTYGGADTLTSCPINLFANSSGTPYSLSDSLFLSFYVQRKGIGDAPEGGDSLKVEFYNPSDSVWKEQWSLQGGTDTIFQRIRVRVSDAKYLKKGFRFRFVNLANLTGQLDHWHLDYVRLKTNITLAIDTVLDDIAFTLPAVSLIKRYTSMPYSHYKALVPNQQNAMRNTLKLRVRNNSYQKRPINSTNDRVYDPTGAAVFTNSQSSNDIAGNSDSTYFVTLTPFAYSPNFGDSAVFEVEHYIGLPADANKHNDTIRFRQEFYNYFAYDDGSAEAGYSINASGGKIAYGFTLLKPDTLRAVQIHFSQLNDDVSNKLFKLAVWKDIGLVGQEELIYEKINQKPVYVDSINGFATYGIPDTILTVSGNIFVGFIQNTADFLNVGLDRNRINNNVMFYNTNGTWFQSQVEGSWMIRPVFGDSIVFTGSGKDLVKKRGKIYPNPANSEFTFESPENIKWVTLRIFDMTGKLFKNSRVINESTINISDLKQGFYLVAFTDTNGQEYFHKLIISR
ncbi:MAG: T9SS type A sorting domain-containing protein, partial [Bacteroidia bacterium]|nr:T9SS type A sorting domain-containing protein [Bacteroidia bacterium]